MLLALVDHGESSFRSKFESDTPDLISYQDLQLVGIP